MACPRVRCRPVAICRAWPPHDENENDVPGATRQIIPRDDYATGPPVYVSAESFSVPIAPSVLRAFRRAGPSRRVPPGRLRESCGDNRFACTVSERNRVLAAARPRTVRREIGCTKSSAVCRRGRPPVNFEKKKIPEITTHPHPTRV